MDNGAERRRTSVIRGNYIDTVPMSSMRSLCIRFGIDARSSRSSGTWSGKNSSLQILVFNFSLSYSSSCRSPLCITGFSLWYLSYSRTHRGARSPLFPSIPIVPLVPFFPVGMSERKWCTWSAYRFSCYTHRVCRRQAWYAKMVWLKLCMFFCITEGLESLRTKKKPKFLILVPTRDDRERLGGVSISPDLEISESTGWIAW